MIIVTLAAYTLSSSLISMTEYDIVFCVNINYIDDREKVQANVNLLKTYHSFIPGLNGFSYSCK